MVKSFFTKDVKTSLKKLENQLNLVVDEGSQTIDKMEADISNLDQEKEIVEELIAVIRDILDR